MNKHIKRIPTYLITAIVAVFLIIWLGSLIKCEILTNKYYDDFSKTFDEYARICLLDSLLIWVTQGWGYNNLRLGGMSRPFLQNVIS